MLDYQRIVDEVRNSLFSDGAEGADFLRTATADYSVACDEINERLRRCGTLLKQGLRSEAIQLAEIEPNLLDIVATLDFPERAHWVDVMVLNDIVPPRPLMLDVAADLNEAYAIEQPLTDLLRQHRLLAIGRGPLNKRVNTLRSLAQSDGNNPIWREDLAVFEKERQKELQSEVAVAAKAGDLAAIAELDDELRYDGWLELPPRELVRYSAETRQRLESNQDRVELTDIVRQLNESHAAFDVDFGRQLRERMSAVSSRMAISPDDELMQQAAPALAWLSEQDEAAQLQSQHDAAVANLESSLRSKLTRKDLVRVYNKARANHFALPDRLERQFRDRLAAIDRATKLKWRAAIGGTVALLVVIAAAAFLIVRQVRINGEVSRQADSLNHLLTAGDLTGAKALVDKLKQGSQPVWQSDQIQALANRVGEAIQKENTRHDNFEAALARAKSAGPASPDYDSLNEAIGLAKTDAEKDQIKQFKDAMAAAENARIAKNDIKLRASLDALERRIKSLESSAGDDVPEQFDEIKKIRSEFDAARAIGPASAEQQSRIGPMLARLDAVEDSLHRRQQEDALLDIVTSKVGDIDAYQGALASFVRQFPNAPQSADFKVALDDARVWTGIAKWNDLLVLFNKQNAATVDSATAASLLTAANAVLKDYDGYPDAAAVRGRFPYLEAIGRRTDSQNQSIVAPLKQLFADPLLSDIWMIELARGNSKLRYYLKQRPQLDPSGPVAVSYIAGFDMAEKHIPNGVRMDELSINDVAPQTGIGRSVRAELGQLNDGNWDATFFHIARTLLTDDPPIDPILKFNLLKQVLDVASNGSHVFETAFAPHVSAIKAVNIAPAANWLDPTDAGAAANRDKAEALFRTLPDINAAAKTAAEELNELGKPVGRPLRWVAWLRHGANGAWQCNPKTLGSLEGNLFIAVKEEGNGASVILIGTLDRGIATINAGSDLHLIEGRPVYLQSP